MKKNRNILVKILLVFNILILAACSTGKDLVKNETVIVKRIDTGSTYIDDVSVRQYDDNVIVSGTVKRRATGRANVNDQLKIVLIAPDGSLIYEEDAIYHRKNHGEGEAYFRIELNRVPDPGSLLKLSLLGS